MKGWEITIQEIFEADTEEEALKIFNEHLKEGLISATTADIEEC